MRSFVAGVALSLALIGLPMAADGHAARSMVKTNVAPAGMASAAASAYDTGGAAGGSRTGPAQMAQAQDPNAESTPQTDGAQQAALRPIMITGSLISHFHRVTPTSVQMLSTKALERTGFTSLDAVLQSLATNGQGAVNQSQSFEFAYGGSGVSLRGLNVGSTLVLVDGERTVPYPMFNGNKSDFVDISSFPMYAIKRVDVMANGGSSIYGGDAIAGVVNLILRRTYQGFKISASSGQSELRDATMEHVGLIFGHGSLNADGHNWYISAEFRHQDQILASNRSGLWDSLNFVPYGGLNETPGAAAAQNITNPFPSTNTGYLINPNNPNQITYLPGCNAAAQANNLCLVANPRAQLQPSTTRFDLLGRYTVRLRHGMTLGVQASYFNSTWEQVYNQGGFTSNETMYPAGFFGDVMIPGAPFNIVPNPPLTITVPANYPGNPYGVPAPLVYSFPELGPQKITSDTSTERLLATLRGRVAGWHLKLRLGAMYSRIIEKQYSELNGIAFQNALNNGYILNSLSSSAATALFAPMMEATPTSQLDIADITGTHRVLQLWGKEPVKGAVGVQWYKEVHNVRAPPACAAGLQICNPEFAIGTERDTSAYAELDAPIVRQLEVDSSVRYDQYQVFGGSTSGSVATLITPFAGTRWRNWVRLRGSWGRAFRPPTAAEGGLSGMNILSGFEADPVLCPSAVPSGAAAGPGDFPSQCAVPISGVVVGNTKLHNVHSTNWEGGLVLQPIRQASLSFNYYNILVSNSIVASYVASGLNAYTQLFRSPSVSLPYCPPSFTQGCTAQQLVNAQTSVGPILAAVYPYVNASNINTSGYDVDFNFHYDAGRYGRFSGEVRWTHQLTYRLTVGGVSYELSGQNGPETGTTGTGNPKDRATLTVSWEKGPLDLTSSVYYTGPFSVLNSAAGLTTCSQALSGLGAKFLTVGPGTPSSFCSVSHFIYTNFYARYQLSSHFAVHAAVQNAFNAQPPLDLASANAGSLFYPYSSAFAQAGVVGRFWILGASYTL